MMTPQEEKAQKIKEIRKQIIGMGILKYLKASNENVHLKYEKKDEQL